MVKTKEWSIKYINRKKRKRFLGQLNQFINNKIISICNTHNDQPKTARIIRIQAEYKCTFGKHYINSLS